MEQNPSAAQATNLATKNEHLRQINPPKEAKLITSLKQAENFADKKSVFAPNQPSAICEKCLTQKTRQRRYAHRQKHWQR